MRVGLIFGGRSTEHRVSLRSARTVARGLAEAGHEVVPLGIAADGSWTAEDASREALAGRLDSLPVGGSAPAEALAERVAERVEALFPIVHGTWGEDGALQGLAEILDLPYVGAGVMTSAVAMDKVAAKRLLGAVGIPVVEYAVCDRQGMEADPTASLAAAGGLPYPLFVKPSVGGSSVGIRKVRDAERLEEAVRYALRFDDQVLIERGVEGRELEVAVLGYRAVEASCVGEIVPGADFYDYADKYLTDAARLIAPAELAPAIAERLAAIAVEAFAALRGWGMARVDFLLEGDDRLYLNEINTLPGFTEISMYPRLWGLSGKPLPELVDRLVEIAVERHRDRRRLDETIKEALAELG